MFSIRRERTKEASEKRGDPASLQGNQRERGWVSHTHSVFFSRSSHALRDSERGKGRAVDADDQRSWGTEADGGGKSRQLTHSDDGGDDDDDDGR